MTPEQAAQRIAEYQRLTGKGLLDITKQGGKICAEMLAAFTPPLAKNASGESSGVSSAARQAGRDAVEYDIRRLFPANPWKHIQRNYGRDRADKFWAVFQAWRGLSKRGRAAAWQDIVSATNEFPLLVATNDVRGFHRTAWKGGKIRLKIKYLAQNQKDVQKLIREKQAKVGYSKGGWAAAARQLGTSRLPQWMRGPGSGTVQSTGARHQARAENLVDWADTVTPQGKKAFAQSVAQKKCQGFMREAIRAIRAKTGN